MGARVGLLLPRDLSFAAAHMAVTSSGGISVPLCTDHPPAEINYVLNDASIQRLLAHDDFSSLVTKLEPPTTRRF